jgi:hypothetical protein
MQAITCCACGHEFDAPVLDRAGPGCPRCGEQLGPLSAGAPEASLDLVLPVALGASFIGVIAAALLLITRI